MAKVTNYRVQIQTDQIIRNLHEAAINDAKVGEGSGFSLINTLMLADQEASGLNPQIMLTTEDGSMVEPSRKKEFAEKIKEYIKFFAGQNYSNMVDESDIHPIFNSREADTETETEHDKKTEDGTDLTNTSESRQLNRLFINRKQRIVCEDIDSFLDGLKLIEEDEKSEPPPEEDNLEVKGYAVDFIFYKGGEKVSILGGKSAKASKFFSGVLADLANFKIATSYGSIPIGKYIAKTSRVFRKTKVNINDVDNNIRNVIKNKMPQSSAIVRVYDCKSLQNNLIKTKQWRPEYNQLFEGCEYAVTIQVETRDKAYEQYNKKLISEICTMAFGDANKVFKIGRIDIKEDDVIKIENYKSEYKSQSIYDKRSSGKDSASATNENLSHYIKHRTAVSILESLFGENADPYMIEESSQHTLNQISSDILIPYIKKHGTTKFQWDKSKTDSEFYAHYNGQKNGKDIKRVIDGMSRFSDIVEMAENEPLVNFRTNVNDKRNKNIINGVYVCIKNMFENANPPKDQPNEDSSKKEEKNETPTNDGDRENGRADISVRFLYKNPDKENPLEQTLSTYVIDSDDKFGKIPLDRFQNMLPRFDVPFKHWNPDPNDITPKNTDYGQIVDVRAVFSNNKNETETNGQSDLYIIPNENLVSDNRKDSYDIASDGTVTAKQNMSDYKNTDFQE